MITHARWIDEKSPYRQKYKMSNNVIIDPAYWMTIGTNLRNAGVFGYEQAFDDYDFMKGLYGKHRAVHSSWK